MLAQSVGYQALQQDDVGEQKSVSRLRLEFGKDLLDDDKKLSTVYILRLQFNKAMMSTLKSLKAKNAVTDLACFSFDLSLRVSESLFPE